METYARAVTSLANDCGIEKLEATNISEALVADPGWQNWKGPYVLIFRGDLWEAPMEFKLVGHSFRITSAGPDQTLGTQDDIIFEVTTNAMANSHEHD